MDLDLKSKVKQIALEQLKESALKKDISVDEVFVVFPDKIESNLSFIGRISKSREMDLLEFQEAIADAIADQVSPEASIEAMKELLKVQIGICEGDKWGPLEVLDQEGKKFSLKHENKEVLMIDFWATWCGYCHEPMQENMSLSEKLKSKGVRIVGISCDEDNAKWKQMLAERKWTSIPQYINKGVRAQMGIRGIPAIGITDQSGKVVYWGHPGGLQLEKTLENLASGTNEVLKHPTEKRQAVSDTNPFWKDLKLEKKKQIVVDVSAKAKGVAPKAKLTFVVVTETDYDEDFKPSPCTTPVFFGQATQAEFDKIKELAEKLSSEYGFKGFRFNIRVG